MFLLGPARVLAVEQPTEVESQVAAVVWLAHGGSLIRAAQEHLVDCSLDSALPGASWLRDLRNLRITEYADLGNPPTESERLDAWQDPDGGEQQQYGYLFPTSPDPDVVLAPPTPESRFPQQPVRNPESSSSRVSVVRFRDSLSHNQIHIRVHTMNQRTHLACEMNQGLLLGMEQSFPNSES